MGVVPPTGSVWHDANMNRGVAALAAVGVLLLAGCGGNIEAPSPALVEESTPTLAVSVDAPTTTAMSELPSERLKELPRESLSPVEELLVSANEARDSSAALEAYVEAAQPYAEAEFARSSDVYRKMDLAGVAPNTLLYIYTYRHHVDADQIRAQLASADAVYDSTARTIIKPEMEQAGINNPVVNWVYLNSDGSHIVTVEK